MKRIVLLLLLAAMAFTMLPISHAGAKLLPVPTVRTPDDVDPPLPPPPPPPPLK